MKNSKYFVIIVTCLLLLGAGCFRKTAQPAVLPDQPDRTSADMTGDFSVSAVDITKEFSLNEFAGCTVHISYPSVPDDQLPEGVGQDFDRAVAQFVAEAFGSASETSSTSELSDLAEAYLEDCRSEIEREYAELSFTDDDLFMNLKRTVDIVYTVELNQAPRLVVGLDEYSYTGGAHPNQRQLYLNVDTDLNKLLTLGDVIKADQLMAFEQYEKTQLLTNYRDQLYPDVAQAYDDLIKNTSNPSTSEQLIEFGNRQNFYLTNASLVTYYDAYEIAPYAAGPILVEIKSDNLSAFLK